MALQETLEAVKRRELAQRLDKGEAEVLAKVAEQLPQPPALDDQTRQDLQPFLQWTTRASVRYAPAKPHVVAAFVIDQAATGASTEVILTRVNAISVLHDRHGLADPTATTTVRAVLNDVVAAPPPPRSWTKEQQAEFKTFPLPAQKVIAAREIDRETHLRRKQNELAEMKKLLRLQAAAASTAADTTTEKETTQ